MEQNKENISTQNKKFKFGSIKETAETLDKLMKAMKTFSDYSLCIMVGIIAFCFILKLMIPVVVDVKEAVVTFYTTPYFIPTILIALAVVLFISCFVIIGIEQKKKKDSILGIIARIIIFLYGITFLALTTYGVLYVIKLLFS